MNFFDQENVTINIRLEINTPILFNLFLEGDSESSSFVWAAQLHCNNMDMKRFALANSTEL